MGQRTSHIYQLVTVPTFYAGFQNAIGADRARRTFIRDFLAPLLPGTKVLDVGCGPATLFGYLGDIDYTGLDINDKHIEQARATYGSRGRFMCGNAVTDLPDLDGQFDVAIASGLLHHLNDTEARALLRRMSELVRPGGRICTIDPVWTSYQSLFAKALKGLDSGKNVRTADNYSELAQGLSVELTFKTYHDLLRIPYDHFAMKLERTTY